MTKKRTKEEMREYQRQRRVVQAGVTNGGVTNRGVTTENRGVTSRVLQRTNGVDYNPDELLPDGRKRYLEPFSDGQVLDRLTVPQPSKHIPGMIAANRANEADLSRGMTRQRRLAMIMRALDKEVTGLDGKRVNLQSMVRYGVSGLTFEAIGELL